MELLEIDDRSSVDRPRTMGEYVPRLVPGQRLRDDVKLLEITQPDGGSFHLDASRVAEIVDELGQPRGTDLPRLPEDERPRPVAHRMSFAEMVVPYRDPTNDHKARTAFDIGEWGLGFMTTRWSWVHGLEEIAYLDVVVHDAHGERGRSRTRSASTRRMTRSCGSTWTPWPVRRCGAPAAW